MIVGDPNLFAIESHITHAYARLSFRALGYFVIHVMGREYGVKAWDASMLANVFDEVGKRIAKRGSCIPPFPIDTTAADIAYAFRRAIYGERTEDELFFGLNTRQFTKAIYSNSIDWSGHSDEAFDDGSYVLHFEDENQVRLVAFTGTPDFHYDPVSLRDVTLSPDAFYRTLQEWHDRFNDEWLSLPKVSETIQ